MSRPILLAVSLILGLAALTLLTSLNGDGSAPSAAAAGALRSLRSSSSSSPPAAPERDMIWKGDGGGDDGGTEDMLARESARLDAEPTAVGAAPGAAKGNDHGEDRNDRQGQAENHDDGGGGKPAPKDDARLNEPSVDEKESDRTTDHLLEREKELHSANPSGVKTLHLIVPGLEPAHLPHVYGYSKRRAGRQGWNTRVWKGIDVDQLVKSSYKHMEKVWADIKKTPELEERKSKMGQFMKLVVLHSQGGVYLDSDLVPCAGLDELIGGVHGPPKGIMSLPYGADQVSRAFAAPPNHPVLTRALRIMKAMQGVDGDMALKRAAYQALKVPTSDSPKSKDGWTIHASVRLGAFTLEGDRQSAASELDLWHLELSSGGGREFLSKCVKDTEDIAPFLEEGCRAEPGFLNRGKFEDCGRTVA